MEVLFAAENEMKLLEKTKVGRDINRPYRTFEELEEDLEKPVVKNLLKLIKFRNTHVSFNGKFYMMKGEEGHLNMRWKNEKQWSELDIDLESMKMGISYSNDNLVTEHLF